MIYFMTPWRIYHKPYFFDVLTHFLDFMIFLSWDTFANFFMLTYVFEVMTYFQYLLNFMTYVLTLRYNFHIWWRLDAHFTYVLCMPFDVLLSILLDVMTYFPFFLTWRTFWHHGVLFDTMVYFLTSWCTFDITTYTFHPFMSWRTSRRHNVRFYAIKYFFYFHHGAHSMRFYVITYLWCHNVILYLLTQWHILKIT